MIGLSRDLSAEISSVPLSEGGADPCYTCGLCSAVCPAKRLVDEAYDPRKLVRMIVLGQEEELLRSDLLWLCLLCDSCSINCPRGVKFSKMMPILRDKAIRKNYVNTDLVKRIAYNYVLPVRGRLECATMFLKLYQRPGFRSFLEQLGLLKLLPESMRTIQKALPPFPPAPMRKVLPDRVPAEGKRILRVAFFLGCADDVLYGDVAQAAISVLSKNGCEVVIPKDVQCCGMPYLGYSDLQMAKELARKNIAALERTGADLIVTDCATCGSFLREYRELLADDPAFAHRASYISDKVRDISQVLVSVLGLRRRPEGELRVRVTYHDPCHLKRSQGVWSEPREILGAIPGLEVVEMEESDLCCGGAGTYNLFHYEESMRILDRKMQNAAATEAEIITTGCPGCITQFRLGVTRKGYAMRVMHPVQLLQQAYQ